MLTQGKQVRLDEAPSCEAGAAVRLCRGQLEGSGGTGGETGRKGSWR